MQNKRVQALALFLSIGFGIMPSLGNKAFSQEKPAIPGQKAPNQNQGGGQAQTPDQKGPLTTAQDDHPHTVAKPPTGPVQQGPIWDGKVADPSKLPPDFDPNVYKVLQQGMFLKAETKSVQGVRVGKSPASIFTPMTPTPAPCPKVTQLSSDWHPNFNDMVSPQKLDDLNWKLKMQEQEHLKVFNDPTQSQGARDQALKEMQKINGQMKANLQSQVKEISDKYYQEKALKEQKEKFEEEQKKAGKDPYPGNGYYGKTYPGVKDDPMKLVKIILGGGR